MIERHWRDGPDVRAGNPAASATTSPGKGWRVLVLVLVLLALPMSTAMGFQFYFFFLGPSSTGQGGNRYFTGSPRYKNYDCRICHVGDPGEIQVRLWTEPENIFDVGYEPQREYKVRLSLLEELKKPPTKIFSTNNFCVEVLDGRGRTVGTFDVGFPTNPIQELFDPVVLSPDRTTMMSGFFNFELDWEWFWTAPESGAGPVIFYCGFVDGSGDLKAFNNDVAVLKQRAEPR
jgi:hypothetical protein